MELAVGRVPATIAVSDVTFTNVKVRIDTTSASPEMWTSASLALAAQRLGVRLSVLAFALSLAPGGTFWLEVRLRQDER